MRVQGWEWVAMDLREALASATLLAFVLVATAAQAQG